MTARMRSFFDHLSDPCPESIGTRLEITALMGEDPNPLPVGTRGTVTGGNGAQIWVDWDNGSQLMLLVGVDKYRVVEP